MNASMRNITKLTGLIACCGAAGAQPAPPNYGFDFVTIGDVGNPAYVGDMFDEDHLRFRGSVGYEYRIATTEIRTSDWAEFVNRALEFNVPVGASLGALHWGASLRTDPNTGERSYQYSDVSGNWPVAGINWRAAAVYCNWLHNGKSLTQEAFMGGAYDISTFGLETDYTDQARRSPDAKFWIPDLDEWMKAAHWDPNKNGPGEGGWWEYSNSSDIKPVTGVPGVGETNANLYDTLGFEAWQVPVGSYPETQSPWGLLDVSGGATEWTESWLAEEASVRITDGSSIDDYLPPEFDPDRIGNAHIAGSPDFGPRNYGLRLASAVPAPSGAALLTSALAFAGRRRRA